VPPLRRCSSCLHPSRDSDRERDRCDLSHSSRPPGRTRIAFLPRPGTRHGYRQLRFPTDCNFTRRTPFALHEPSFRGPPGRAGLVVVSRQGCFVALLHGRRYFAAVVCSNLRDRLTFQQARERRYLPEAALQRASRFHGIYRSRTPPRAMRRCCHRERVVRLLESESLGATGLSLRDSGLRSAGMPHGGGPSLGIEESGFLRGNSSNSFERQPEGLRSPAR
jgi:hypothetical protein